MNSGIKDCHSFLVGEDRKHCDRALILPAALLVAVNVLANASVD